MNKSSKKIMILIKTRTGISIMFCIQANLNSPSKQLNIILFKKFLGRYSKATIFSNLNES